MAYFKYTGPFNSFKYESEWKKTLQQIGNSPIHLRFPSIQNVAHPIEVKALHIFTFACRFLNMVDVLVQSQGEKGWHTVFVETSVLLFPIIEIVGNAIRAEKADKLASGLYWLHDPYKLPGNLKARDITKNDVQLRSIHKHLPPEQDIPFISNLYQLRNYYIHGVIRSSDPNLPKEENIISYILPKGMAGAIEDGLYSYWDNLINDNGNLGWVDRLASADIHPFIIQGSQGFADDGLIDPYIIDRLQQKKLRDNPQ